MNKRPTVIFSISIVALVAFLIIFIRFIPAKTILNILNGNSSNKIDLQNSQKSLRINDVIPSAALPGDVVTINFSGDFENSPLWVVLNNENIISTPVSGKENTVFFQVPDNANGGELYLKQDERNSNSVWFSVPNYLGGSFRPDSIEETPIILDELGNELAANFVILIMKEDYDNEMEAQRVADLQDGKIVERIPLIDGYTVKLKTKTIEELRAAVDILESDTAVDFVMLDHKAGDF